MVFSSSPIEEIKERLDIVQVISEYVRLQKVGANYRALCPFHSETKPSFYVSPAKQIWHCFGCNLGGDIFKFIMLIEGVEFKDALSILAKKAGVELKPEPIEKRTERQRLYEICEIATRFFEKQLKETKKGGEVKEYLLSRGISEESIKKWRIGYAPNTWRSLSNFLVSKGYKREEVIKAGLAVPKEGKEEISSPWDSYDRFRGRIIFPIFDVHGQVIGFGGRVFGEEEKKEDVAKYINTPNTPLYDKSRVLYGIDKAKTEIRKRDGAIIVEGYTDVILSHQAGFENAIAVSGTALTPYQLRVISRYSKNLFLSFDMDVAGETATKRGIDLAQLLGFNIKIISLPEGKDPADIVKEDPKEWQKAVENAEEILQFYFNRAFSQFDKNSIEGKRKISEILLPLISRIQSKIEQSHWVKEFARNIEADEKAIWEEVRRLEKDRKSLEEIEEKIKISEKDLRNLGIEVEERSPSFLVEERVLMLLWNFAKNEKTSSSISNYIEKISSFWEFTFPEGKEVFEILKEKKKELPESLKEFISTLEFKYEIESQKEDFSPQKELDFCIERLWQIWQKKEIEKIKKELQEAERSNDKEKVKELLKKLSQIRKK